MSGMKTAGLLCTAAAVTKYILLDHVCIQLEDTTSSWHYALNFDNPAPICITASVQGQVLTHEYAVICHLQRLSFCQMSCRLSVTRQMFVLSRLCLYWHDRMQQEIPVFLAYCTSRTLCTFPGMLSSMAVWVNPWAMTSDRDSSVNLLSHVRPSEQPNAYWLPYLHLYCLYVDSSSLQLFL